MRINLALPVEGNATPSFTLDFVFLLRVCVANYVGNINVCQAVPRNNDTMHLVLSVGK